MLISLYYPERNMTQEKPKTLAMSRFTNQIFLLKETQKDYWQNLIKKL